MYGLNCVIKYPIANHNNENNDKYIIEKDAINDKIEVEWDACRNANLSDNDLESLLDESFGLYCFRFVFWFYVFFCLHFMFYFLIVIYEQLQCQTESIK